MKQLLLFVLAALATSCAGLASSPFVFQTTVSGEGDVRSDGDTIVMVGRMAGVAGVRVKGTMLPPTSVFNLDRGEVWIRSASRGVDLRQSVRDPLPAWCRELYTQADLDLLAGLGILLTFEQPEPTP